jgi:hypothetical protein
MLSQIFMHTKEKHESIGALDDAIKLDALNMDIRM